MCRGRCCVQSSAFVGHSRPLRHRRLSYRFEFSRLDNGNATLTGMLAYLRRHPRVRIEYCSQINHRSFTLGAHHHIARWSTPAADGRGRLCATVRFKRAKLIDRAPRYLSLDFRRVADIPSRRRLRSPMSDVLFVHPTRHVSVAFPVGNCGINFLVTSLLPSDSFPPSDENIFTPAVAPGFYVNCCSTVKRFSQLQFNDINTYLIGQSLLGLPRLNIRLPT